MDSGFITSQARLPELLKTALNYPAIDNHAHPLLKAPNRAEIPFEGVFSEAHGEALSDAVHTVAAHRATHDLSELFGLPQGSSWEAVKAVHLNTDYEELCRQSFRPTGIQCILIDDGLGANDIVHNIAWHDQFTSSPSKRVVRIEVEAETILQAIFEAIRSNCISLTEGFTKFVTSLTDTLALRAQEANVAAFKSVVCYRSGLAISTGPVGSQDIHAPREGAMDTDSLVAFNRLYDAYCREQATRVRLQDKPLNDHVVRMALDVATKYAKPVQFHTGVGDNDLVFALSSPAFLQPIIKAYPQVKFVLLHGSYPFTREAGYLTSVYPNVFLDYGEIFPIVSGHGQRSILRQVLELAPTNKIMWSTDGHFWPESYYLGSIQARRALYQVLSEIVHSGDLSEPSAVRVIQNTLFDNANRLYGLGLLPHTNAERSEYDSEPEINTRTSTFDFL